MQDNGLYVEYNTEKLPSTDYTKSPMINYVKEIAKVLKDYEQGSSKIEKTVTIDSMYHPPSLKKLTEHVESYDYMSYDEIEVIKQRMSESSNQCQEADMSRDYDSPVNKWELSVPSKETRLKNRKKRKYKK